MKKLLEKEARTNLPDWLDWRGAGIFDPVPQWLGTIQGMPAQ
jgi:hypothetical protein